MTIVRARLVSSKVTALLKAMAVPGISSVYVISPLHYSWEIETGLNYVINGTELILYDIVGTLRLLRVAIEQSKVTVIYRVKVKV